MAEIEQRCMNGIQTVSHTQLQLWFSARHCLEIIKRTVQIQQIYPRLQDQNLALFLMLMTKIQTVNQSACVFDLMQLPSLADQIRYFTFNGDAKLFVCIHIRMCECACARSLATLCLRNKSNKCGAIAQKTIQ